MQTWTGAAAAVPVAEALLPRLKISHSNSSSTYGSSQLCAATRHDKFTSPKLQDFISVKKSSLKWFGSFKRYEHILNATGIYFRLVFHDVQNFSISSNCMRREKKRMAQATQRKRKGSGKDFQIFLLEKEFTKPNWRNENFKFQWK